MHGFSVLRVNVMHKRPRWALLLAGLIGQSCCVLLFLSCLLALDLFNQLLDLPYIVVELAVLSGDLRQLGVQPVHALPAR